MRSWLPILFLGLFIFLAAFNPLGAASVRAASANTHSDSQGNCPDGYLKLSVPLNNGDDCLLSNGIGNDNPIYVYLRSIIQFLSAGVGVVVVLMLIISGIQYTTSAANPQALQAAKKRMANAIIGLLLFIFMVAILNFIIPGKLIL